MVYQRVEGHPDPGKPITTDPPGGQVKKDDRHPKQEDARRIDAGMKRSLEGAEQSRATQHCGGRQLDRIRREHPGRIMPSRFIFTKKAGEVGEDWKAKARWILLGHRDPDAAQLERYAPTPSSTTVMLCLQIIASSRYRLFIMDVSSAFGQSDPHEREQGPLYATMSYWHPWTPKLGIRTAVYGLVSAPAVWRKSVRRHLLAGAELQGVDQMRNEHLGKYLELLE